MRTKRRMHAFCAYAHTRFNRVTARGKAYKTGKNVSPACVVAAVLLALPRVFGSRADALALAIAPAGISRIGVVDRR